MFFFTCLLSALFACSMAQNCTSKLDCTSCVADSQCGWCQDDLNPPSCMAGTAAIPAACSGNDQTWNYGTCSFNDPCGSQGVCDDCINTPGCGYCFSEGSCQKGVGACTAPGDFSTTSCTPVLPCKDYTDCEDCTAAPKGCAFCSFLSTKCVDVGNATAGCNTTLQSCPKTTSESSLLSVSIIGLFVVVTLLIA